MMVIAKGLFKGQRGHEFEGNFEIVEREDGVYLDVDDEFSFDGSPEPAFTFSRTVPTSQGQIEAEGLINQIRFGEFPKHVPFGGARSIKLPNGIDVREFQSLVLWCFEQPFFLGIGEMEFVDG